MDLQRIVGELKQEREKLDRAITALDGSGPGIRGRRAKPGNGRRHARRHMSAEARKRISEMMKKRWAERRRKKAA